MASSQHSGSPRPGEQFPEVIPWLQAGKAGRVGSLDAPRPSESESTGRREDGKFFGGGPAHASAHAASPSSSSRADQGPREPSNPSRLPASLLSPQDEGQRP